MPGLAHKAWVENLLEQAGLDAVVAASPEHVFLLTGHSTWLERQTRTWMVRPAGTGGHQAGFAVLTADGRVGLVVSPVVHGEAQARGVEYLRRYERTPDSTGPVKALRELLADMDAEDCRVGLERDGLDPTTATALPASWPDASLLLRLARMVKSPEAIARIRTATEGAEWALDAIAREWPEFDDASAIQSRFRLLLAERGLEVDHFVYGTTAGGVGITEAPPGNPAQMLFIDAGARHRGFVSDVGVTFAAEPDDGGAGHVYAQALEVIQAGVAHLRPGVRASAVADAMRDHVPHPALRAQGHGLGIGIREWPFFGHPSGEVLVEGNLRVPVDQLLQPGTVVNLEIGGHLPDDRSLQIECTYLIGESGAEAIVEQRRGSRWLVGEAGRTAPGPAPESPVPLGATALD